MLLINTLLAALLCAAGFCHWSRFELPSLRRTAFGVGSVAITMLFVLGALWPSIHTVLALLALPALPLFLVGLVRPGIAGTAWVRWYGLFAVALAPLAYALQLVWWLQRAWGRP